jgi:hypothetical protein
MGMTGFLLRLTPSALDEYKKASSLLEKRILDYYENYNPEIEDVNPIRVDRAWHGILFLLTGESFDNYSHPLAKIFFSGQLLDENQNMGYGPAHYLTPDQVAEINLAIAKISIDDLKSRFDAKKMTDMEIYPGPWEEDGIIDYLTYYFAFVQQIFSEAARNDEAMIALVC